MLLTGGSLSDVLVNAAQRLIQAAHSHVAGLQDVSLGLTLAFDVIQGEFVQVLHTGAGHWVTISTIGCGPAEVDVFDSLCPFLNGALERQIAELLCTEQDVITVRYVMSSYLMLNNYVDV